MLGSASCFLPLDVMPAVLLLLLLVSPTAFADSFLISWGIDVQARDDDPAGLLTFEYTGPSLYQWGNKTLAFGAAARVEEGDEFFLGGGAVFEWAFTPTWFFEFSLMPGFYDPRENGRDIGGNFHFRSLFGLGLVINQNTIVSVAIDHLSNASIEDSNPGTESVTFRHIWRF